MNDQIRYLSRREVQALKRCACSICQNVAAAIHHDRVRRLCLYESALNEASVVAHIEAVLGRCADFGAPRQ